MKTYEEMARDVLKRRDEELQKTQITPNDPISFNAPPEVVYPAPPKKRGLMPRIAIPCAAAVTAAAVGICIWNKIPQRRKYINNLVADADQDKLDFIFEAFESHKYKDPIIPVTFESVYKGGKTEININKAEQKDVYPFNEMNIVTPDMPNDEDFISIADEGINSYYGMEFDRLSTVFEDWKSEHQPFGYYDRDTETNDTAEHSIHGYYTLNTIAYTAESGSGVSVSASFNKLEAAVENAKASLINGFDAFIYQTPGGGFVVDIDMGATVRIYASGVHKDTLIKIIDAYTKPRAELTKISFEEINILDEMPRFLRENDPFAAKTITEEYYTKDITKEYANDFYGIEFDRLGRLHKDWYEDGKDDLKILFTIGTSSVQNVCEINTLSYGTPADGYIKVSANKGSIPEPETDPGNGYRNSYINGHYALIYRGGRSGDELGAMIEFGGTVVELSAAEFTEDDFINILKEYTENSVTENEHPDNSEPNNGGGDIKLHDKAPEFFDAENPFGVPNTPNLSACDFEPYTIEQLNDFYAIEFDRLTRLHTDWKEWHGDTGIYTLDEAPVYTRNAIDYQLANGAFVNVEVKLGGELPVEVFNAPNNTTPETTYSKINGCQAMLSRTGFAGEDYNTVVYPNGDHKFGAVIKMGNALVHFKTAGLTEEEFMQFLDEFTSTDNADSTKNDIVIHPEKPQAFAEKDPFLNICGNLFDPADFKKYSFEDLNGYYSNPATDLITIDPDDLVKYTMEELNNYYGIEFDRLTRLHGDWEELHGNLGIYRHNFNYTEYGDYDVINWTHNAIHYTLPDSSVLTVEAQEGGKLPDLERWSSPTPRYSTVNGCKAMIYLDGNDNKTYPNGSSIITAVIEKNGTLIRLKSAGFTEEQFLNVLDEYTK